MISPLMLVRAVVLGAVFCSAGLRAQSVSVELMGGVSAKTRPVSGAASSAGKSTLALHQIALYKNGVAFFERSGFVTGDALIHIDFTTAQLNEVLQSLTATDLGGGTIAGLNYDNSTTLGQQLDQLHLGLGPDPTVTDFLNTIKGRQVEVRGGAGSVVTGKLLNVEVRPVTNPRNGERSEKRFVSVVTASGGLRTVELTPLVEVRLVEAEERVEIGRYLKILATTHDPPMRHLTLEAKGTGRREIRIGYLGKSAAWKSNYRLLVTNGGETKSATLQGFAVVDNTSDADWENVQLTLVSGSPDAGRRSQQGAEDGWVNVSKDAARAVAAAPPVTAAPAGSYQEQAKNSLGVGVTSHALDDLVQYKVAKPTTIRHGESSMIPIVQATVGAERVLVWMSREANKGVQRALWLDNSTGVTLDKGSMTLLEDGTFAGQGEIPLMPPANRRLVAYGTDDAVKVIGREAKDPPSEVRHIVVKDGELILHRRYYQEHDYTVQNAGATARTVVIGTAQSGAPRSNPGFTPWQLSNRTPATETSGTQPTGKLYRFEVRVDAGSTQTLKVMETHVHPTHQALAKMKADDLATVIRESSNNPEVIATLQPIMEAKRHIDDLDAQLKDAQKAIDEANAEEVRLRQNISALKGSAEERPLTKRYSDAMLAQEDKLAALQSKREAARQQKVETEKTLSGEIHALAATDIQLPGSRETT